MMKSIASTLHIYISSKALLTMVTEYIEILLNIGLIMNKIHKADTNDNSWWILTVILSILGKDFEWFFFQSVFKISVKCNACQNIDEYFTLHSINIHLAKQFAIAV
jgi:hypothetical protein